MTALVKRLKVLPRRLPPLPMWVLMGLSWLAIGAALATLLVTAEVARRVAEVERAEQLKLQRQQAETLQRLADECVTCGRY
jgi:hypothetical protein